MDRDGGWAGASVRGSTHLDCEYQKHDLSFHRISYQVENHQEDRDDKARDAKRPLEAMLEMSTEQATHRCEGKDRPLMLDEVLQNNGEDRATDTRAARHAGKS